MNKELVLALQKVIWLSKVTSNYDKSLMLKACDRLLEMETLLEACQKEKDLWNREAYRTVEHWADR